MNDSGPQANPENREGKLGFIRKRGELGRAVITRELGVQSMKVSHWLGFYSLCLGGQSKEKIFLLAE